MIKNIVFDIGNVLLRFDAEGFLKDKLKDSSLINLAHKEIFRSKEWELLDRGVIEERDAIKAFVSRNPAHEKLIVDIFSQWQGILVPIEKSIDFLRDASDKGYKLYYLSNFHKIAFSHVTSKHDFFNLFHGGVVSYLEGLIKPEREIYELLIDRYNIKPKESLFIDDMIENIDQAKNMGFETIHFTGKTDLGFVSSLINPKSPME